MFLSLIFCFIFLISFPVVINGKGCGENCECGISKNIQYYEEFNNDKVLGGKESDPQDWPFIVRLSIGCTGSIISNQWILSAAHCEFGLLGGDDRNVTVQINGVWHETHKYIIHEDFDKIAASNDIMLLQLKEPLEFSENVSRSLNINTEIIFDDNQILRETPIFIRDLGYCHELLKYINTETVICAGGVNNGATRGDSGGPLMVIREHRWIQYGVVSGGKYFPIPGNPFVVACHALFGTQLVQDRDPNVALERISPEELIDAARHMKANSAPGADNISSKVVKSTISTFAERFASALNGLFEANNMPPELFYSKTILLYKKGNRLDIGNYRPISLLRVIVAVENATLLSLNRFQEFTQKSARSVIGLKIKLLKK